MFVWLAGPTDDDHEGLVVLILPIFLVFSTTVGI